MYIGKYEVGQMVEGYVLDNAGEYVQVIGSFVSRTDDDEEYIQDIIIRTADGNIVYIDEQDARPYSKSKEELMSSILSMK